MTIFFLRSTGSLNLLEVNGVVRLDPFDSAAAFARCSSSAGKAFEDVFPTKLCRKEKEKEKREKNRREKRSLRKRAIIDASQMVLEIVTHALCIYVLEN